MDEVQMKKEKTRKERPGSFKYSNRRVRRMTRDKNEKKLTKSEALGGVTRLQKWAEVTRDNIQMGKNLNDYFMNNMIHILDQEEDIKRQQCLESLESFYGDKEKALNVHNNNLRLQGIITDKKISY